MEEDGPQQAASEAQDAILLEGDQPVTLGARDQTTGPEETHPKSVEAKVDDLQSEITADPVLETTKIEDNKAEELIEVKDGHDTQDSGKDSVDSKESALKAPEQAVTSEASLPEIAESQNKDSEAEPKPLAEVKAVKEDPDKATEQNTEIVAEKVSSTTTTSEKVATPLPQSDHVKKSKDKSKKDKSEMEADMSTLFILDLMKQRKEKQMRKKKDDLINDLAMKKKQQMMDARMGKRVMTRPAFGGFVGVNAILAGSKHTSPATRRRTPKPRPVEPDVEIPPPERTDLLIMGIIRDKKEQAYHEAHQVMAEAAGVPSDDKWMAKFED